MYMNFDRKSQFEHRLVKYFFIIFITFIFSSVAYAKKNKRTWDYPLHYYKKFEIVGSEDFFKFKFDLRKDEDVIKEISNNGETGIIGYLLYEDDKIVIDELDMPTHTKKDGRVIIDGLLPSHSIGKSLVSYVTGHAICEGYIKSVHEKITGWKTVQNTLYQDQVLIDLLNMQAGDDKYVGERIRPRADSKLKKYYPKISVNTVPLRDLLQFHFQGSKKHIPSFNAKKPKYNYSALTTNVIMNYVIYKTGKDWEQLLHKVFNNHIKVKENVRFLQTEKRANLGSLLTETGRYSFYATRYDYLRIAKAMLDDWHNNTCAGKYLKMLYKQRIKKDKSWRDDPVDVAFVTNSYGGQFHFDISGLQKRKIIGMSGFAGQQILIDIDKKRIIVVNSFYRNYDWKKIVYDKIKH